jgi:hypothetical protein
VTPLGTIKAKRGQVRIDGPLGCLWEYPVRDTLSERDRYELEAAARAHGHPPSQILRAGEAAAKAAMQTKEPR